MPSLLMLLKSQSLFSALRVTEHGCHKNFSAITNMKSIHDVYKRKCKQRKNQDRIKVIEELDNHEKKAASMNLPWRIMTSVVIERLPVVIEDLEPWEKDYEDLKNTLLAYGKEYPEEYNILEPGHEVNTDGELLAQLKEAGFTPAPRITEADEKDDRHSLERALPKSLYLMIALKNRRPGPMGKWGFPQGLIKPEETMRESAERIVAEQLGQNMDLFWLSNAPEGWFFYPFSEATQKKAKAYGEKIWFYRTQLIGGEPNIHSRMEDYAWVQSTEFNDYVPKDLSGYFQQILL
mmetsp:Transcript_21729/g.28127  ORF Transcript_21729/g.28127 Transcript_21729/m.28127 type:complete len:292 (+) Transcript_21729:75-950(+)